MTVVLVIPHCPLDIPFPNSRQIDPLSRDESPAPVMGGGAGCVEMAGISGTGSACEAWVSEWGNGGRFPDEE